MTKDELETEILRSKKIDKDLSINAKAEDNTIQFHVDDNATTEPILKLCPNGDIFVKGRLVENDKEVVEALREFILKRS